MTGGTGRRAEALSAIIAAAGSTASLADVLEAVVTELSSEADASFVYLLDDAGQRLVLRAASAPYEHLADDVALDRGSGFAWLAVERREPLMVERPATDPRSAPVRGIDEEAFGASLAAPMIARDGDVLGVVTFSLAAHAVFDEADADFLVSAATVAAAAVDNARLHAETRQRALQQEAVARLGLRALAITEPRTLMNELTAVVAETLAADLTTVFELEPHGETLVMRAGHGWPDGAVGFATIGAGEGSLGGRTLSTREPVLVPDITSDDRFTELGPLLELGVTSSAVVLIHGRDRPFGVLGAHFRAARKLTPDDVAFLQTAANVLSEAVEWARSRADLVETSETLRALVEASPLPIVATDLTGNATLWNRAAEQLYGWKQTDVLGGPLPMVPSSELELLRADRLDILAGGGSRVSEVDRVRRDGMPLRVEIVKAPILGDAGALRGVVAVHRDVTEQRRAEASIHRRDAMLEVLGEAAEQFLRSHSLAPVIDRLIGRLGEVGQVSCVSVWENGVAPDGSGTATLRHEWTASGMEPLLGDPASIDTPWEPDFARWVELMSGGESVVGRLSEFPATERAWWGDVDVRSIAAFPIMAGGEWWGYISFEDLAEGRAWEAAETEALRAASAMLGAAIQRTRTEAALRSSEEQLRRIIETSVSGMWVLDSEGRVLFANRQMAELVGAEVGDLLGHLVYEFVDEETQVMLADNLERRRSGISERYELRYRRRDGAELWVLVSAAPIHDDSGTFAGSLAIVTDITERRLAEEALRRSEELLARAQEIARLGSWEWDPATDHLRWSDETFRICGFEPQAFTPTNTAFHELVPAHDQTLLWQATERVTRGEPYAVEHRIVRPDGEVRFVREEGRADLDATGRLVRLIGTIQDVTDQRRAEEERRLLEAQIQHSQKLESLGVIAGGIAHDFNNLLMGMLGNAGLALLDAPEGTLRERLQQIETAARRAADLTNQLLAYAGKATFDVVPLDLAELVREMANLLEVSIPRKVRLTLDLEHGLPAVEADPTQIRQVVMNLITNAAEAIGDADGAIAIRIRLADVRADELAGAYAGPDVGPGLFLSLEVEDTGSGMDASTLERIFDPFYTTKFAGRGLGLAAVLGIVRSHDGAVLVRSAPGQGTRFRVVLPPSATRVGTSEMRSDAVNGLPGATVLVVDDDDSVRAVTKAMLERLGYTTLTACDGREAVDLFRSGGDAIDLVILDVTMPVMDGIETLRALRAAWPDVRVILSSGHPEYAAEERLGDDRPSGFIQKPYTPAELAERLTTVLQA